MHDKQVFDLLTKEYTLILATTTQDFSNVKKLREAIITHHYPEFKKTEQYDQYLFSSDDKQSFIYLIRHNDSNSYIGTVRIFFINHHTSSKIMPIQKMSTITNMEYLQQDMPICEISRLNLSTTFKEHKNFSALKLRTHLTMLLMVATRINFFLYHYSAIFSIMESSLDRVLKRQGVNFRKIGPMIDYYGKRTPFAIERNKLLSDTEETMGKITNYYLKKLCENPEPFWEFIDNNPYLERSDIHLDEICKLFEEFGDDADLTVLLDEKEIVDQSFMV